MPARPPNKLQVRIGDVVKELLAENDPHDVIVAVVATAVTIAIGKEMSSIYGDRELGPRAQFRFAHLCKRVWEELRSQTLTSELAGPDAPAEAN